MLQQTDSSIQRNVPAPWLVLIYDSSAETCGSLEQRLTNLSFEGHPLVASCVSSLDEAKRYLDQHLETALLIIGRLVENPEENELELIYYLRETLGNYRTRIYPCEQNTRQPEQSNPWQTRFALEQRYDHLLFFGGDFEQTLYDGLLSYQKYVAAVSFDQHPPSLNSPSSSATSYKISWQCSPGFPIHSISAAAAELLGYEPEEFSEGHFNFLDWIAEDDKERFIHSRQEEVQSINLPVSEEYRIVTKSGESIWVFAVSTKTLSAESDILTETATLFIDLENLKQRPGLLLDPTIGLLQINQEQKIQYINHALSEVLGAGYPGVMGRDLGDWLSQADHDRLAQFIEIALTTKQPQQFKLEIGPTGGRHLAVCSLSISGYKSSGNTGLHLLVELMERRQAREKELTQELLQERAFIASASHELRTPLSAVLGYAELLKDAKNLDSEQQAFLNNIVTNSKHLVTLVNDILDLSKIESNQLSLNIEEVVFSDLFTSSGVMISSQVKEGVKLIVNAPDLAHFVLCDPIRIKQIFLNLLSNAAKFTPQGVIKIYMDQYKSLDTNLFQVRICIEDTGAGIPKARQKELFQPFKQVHAGSYGGTGLGLYLSQQIARLMDGKITLKSDLGRGTTFYVDLVLTKGKVKGDQFAFGGKQVVIFGDYPTLSDQQKAKLQKTGAKIDFIDCMDPRNHDRLRKAFSYDTVDLAIFDVDVLQEKTLWYAGAIKETYPGVSLIGLKRENCKEQCKLLDQLLLKPFSYYQLASALAEEFNRFKPSMQLDYTQLKILIVEDVEANRMLFSQMFQRFFNLEPSLAVSGKDAVKQVKSKQFDLVYMDVEMPEMDGIEATKKIREFDQRTPIVAMTGNVFAEDIQATKDAGMTGFLSKPIQKEDLERTLSELFTEEQAEPPMFAEEPGDEAVQPVQQGHLSTGHSPLEQMKAAMLEHLSDLSDDTNTLNEIVETAILEIQETFGKIVEYNGRKDQQGLAKSLHKLKGILLNMNVQPLGSQVQELEIKIKEGEGDDLLADFIQQLFELVKTP